MRIAVPLAAGKLSLHFGHCESFAFLDVHPKTKTVRAVTEAAPPPHEPGVLPRWLAEQKTDLVIAGGMGSRAQALFREQGIEVVVGAPAETPQALAEAYLAGTLETGDNLCAH
jgi:predicted Fe-Mo cluster-binding NifX family protein